MPTRGSVVAPRGSLVQTAEPAVSRAQLQAMYEAMQPASVRPATLLCVLEKDSMLQDDKHSSDRNSWRRCRCCRTSALSWRPWMPSPPASPRVLVQRRMPGAPHPGQLQIPWMLCWLVHPAQLLHRCGQSGSSMVSTLYSEGKQRIRVRAWPQELPLPDIAKQSPLYPGVAEIEVGRVNLPCHVPLHKVPEGLNRYDWARQVITLQKVQPSRADTAALARRPEDASFETAQALAPIKAPAGLPSVEPAAGLHRVRDSKPHKPLSMCRTLRRHECNACRAPCLMLSSRRRSPSVPGKQLRQQQRPSLSRRSRRSSRGWQLRQPPALRYCSCFLCSIPGKTLESLLKV